MKCCSHYLVHETTEFTNNTLSVLPNKMLFKTSLSPMMSLNVASCKIGGKKMPMKMPGSSSFIILLSSSSDSFNEVSKGCNFAKLL